MKLQCKMVGCSNEQSIGIKYLTHINILEIDRNGFWFNDLRSSTIRTIEFKVDLVIITTLNTTYTFVIV